MDWTPVGEGVSARLGDHSDLVASTLQRAASETVTQRIWSGDFHLWGDEPTEITNRLGWLRTPEHSPDWIAEAASVARGLASQGLSQVLLVGMGGSSLAPELFARVFATAGGGGSLTVLDTTHPETVAAVLDSLDPDRTAIIASTKSGGTVETLSLTKAAFARIAASVGAEQAARRVVAITDPGSSLETLGKAHHFRAIVFGDPEIGGRYSALSPFGLLPAAVVGVNLGRLTASAARMAEACRFAAPPGETNPGLWLGAVMGALAGIGRDRLQLVLSPSVAAFGGWIEQLVAESSGKLGRGILPVVGGFDRELASGATWDEHLVVHIRQGEDPEGVSAVDALPKSVPVVRIDVNDPEDLGGEFFRWEFATAVACWQLGINAFDQPNVESAKRRATQMLAAYTATGQLPSVASDANEGPLTMFGARELAAFVGTSVQAADPQSLSELLAGLRRRLGSSSYVAVQAYLPYSDILDAGLARLQRGLRMRLDWTTTVGYGPRFLHSTGQLHKGDRGDGLFLQLVGPPARDVPIPDELGGSTSSVSFATLIEAQSLGDRQALLDAGRHVLRLDLGPDVAVGLAFLCSVVEGR